MAGWSQKRGPWVSIESRRGGGGAREPGPGDGGRTRWKARVCGGEGSKSLAIRTYSDPHLINVYYYFYCFSSQEKELSEFLRAALPFHPRRKQAGAGLDSKSGGWSHCAPHGCPCKQFQLILTAFRSPQPGADQMLLSELKGAGRGLPALPDQGVRGKAWSKLESLGQSSGPGRPQQAERRTCLGAGLQAGWGPKLPEAPSGEQRLRGSGWSGQRRP